VPWPSPQDFSEALQNPRSSFLEPELQRGTPELNHLGLPKPRSGANAIVYKIKSEQVNWAVRCFLRNIADQQQRYAAINSFLKANPQPFFVGFEYLPAGIRVGTTYYPILRMEWVDGEPLDKYIEKHIVDTAALAKLAEKWLQMAQALQKYGIAHGDLQQGNVLVVGDGLKLVDYDGMYVPALNGKLSSEIGHRNYQHPRRSEFDFGPNVDNFSNWVIYTALTALSKNPALWNTFRADESVLFRREDFVSPLTSRLFSTLMGSSDQVVHSLAANLQGMASQPFYATPYLDPSIIKERVGFEPAAFQKVSPWWSDHVKLEEPSVLSSDSSWIDDHTVEPINAVITRAGALERLILIGSFASVSVLVLALSLTMIQTLLGLLLLVSAYAGCLFWRYKTDPGLQSLFRGRSGLGEKLIAFHSVESVFLRYQKLMSAAHQGLEDARQKKTQVLSRLTTEENAEVSKAQDRLRSKVGEVAQRRRKLADQENSELQQVNAGAGKQLNAAQADLLRIDNDQTAELSAALASVQGDFILQFLRRFDIQTAGISGIASGYKIKLNAAGVLTAADVDYRVHRIHGIGTVKAAALFAWRHAYEQSARARMPQDLDLSQQQNIRNKYSTRRQALQQQIMNLQAMRQKQEEAVKQRYIALRVPLDREEAEIHRSTTEDMQRIRTKFTEVSKKAAAKENQSIAAHEKLTVERKKLADESEIDCSRKRREYERVQRRLMLFDGITFQRYVSRVFTGR
jgi:hypothetical protein